MNGMELNRNDPMILKKTMNNFILKLLKVEVPIKTDWEQDFFERIKRSLR